MASMYDTILGLPLFHGLDHDAISQFVEKVPVHFGHYSAGETIFTPGQSCEGLTFILSGNAHIRISNSDNTFAISYQIPKGCVIGAEYLYGIERAYPYTVIAHDNLDTLEVTKKDFVWLMSNNDICGINYFNYLSRRSQRPIEGINLMGAHSLQRCVMQWVSQYTETRARHICIECSQEQFATLTGLTIEQVAEAEQEMLAANIARRTPAGLELVPWEDRRLACP